MKKTVPVLALSVLLVLTGCDRLGIGNPFDSQVSCSSDEAKNALIELIRNNAEKEITADFDGKAGDLDIADIGISRIRDMLAQLGMSVDEVRTMEKTDKSSKLKCEATLKLEVPDNMLMNAVSVNQIIDENGKKTTDFFERHYRKDGAYYVRTIAYSVQPTDDKTKIFSELNQVYDVVHPISELVSMALLREPLEKAQKMDEELAKAESAAAEAMAAEEAAEQEALAKEQESARLAEWEERYKLSRSGFESFWKGLPEAVQNKLTKEQKTWKSGIDKICSAKAKAEGATPNDLKVGELECKTAETEARLEELSRRKKALMEEIAKDVEKKERAARAALENTVQSLPAEVAEAVMPEYREWANALSGKCANGDEYGLAQSACRTKEMNAKTKEFQGYLVH